MRLSIIIVSWNTTVLLEKCVESIFRFVRTPEFEVIVVDNASSDFDQAAFRTRFPHVRLIANRENLGYAEGNNQAIAEAHGDYILLLNPDTEMKDDVGSILVAFMQTHPDAAAAGCKLVRPDGSVDRSVRGFPHPLAIASEWLGLSRAFPKSRRLGAYRMTWFGYDRVAEVDQPMGSCLILNRKAVEQIGAFDQVFPIFFNEVDWCYRAKEAGWRIYFTPEAEMIHHGAASTRQVRRHMVRESHRSLARFYRKHYRSRIFPPVYWAILAAIRLSERFSSR